MALAKLMTKQAWLTFETKARLQRKGSRGRKQKDDKTSKNASLPDGVFQAGSSADWGLVVWSFTAADCSTGTCVPLTSEANVVVRSQLQADLCGNGRLSEPTGLV